MAKLDINLAALTTMSPAQLQERAFGGLSAVTRRTLDSVARNGTVSAEDLPIRLKPGTRLMRQWNGRMHSVLVTEEGYQFDGRTWASLSAIAERITGAHWSGPRFFGLRRASAPPVQVPRDGK
jgi:hypothetical protein